MRTPYVSYVLLSKIILLSFCSFYLKLESLYVSYVEHILVAVVVLAPYPVLPRTLHDVGHALLVLRVSVLRGQLSRHLPVEHIAAPLHCYPATLEILGCSILFLILALSVCAHRNNCY